MPVYNTAPFLQECLESIIAQTYTDWELIAINDFSTDESADILEHYSKMDSRISWYPNEKKGIIPALEKAFSYSTGDMIHRMDSDDIMPEDKLDILYRLLSEKGLGTVVTGQVRYFTRNGQVQGGFLRYAAWLNQHTERATWFDDIFYECPIASPAWLIYREDLLRIGGITQGRYPEDYDLVFRMYLHGMEVAGSPEIVHYWRDWAHRASRTQEVYADQLFFDLKLFYFKNYKHSEDQEVLLWGAGHKGKKLSQKMQQENIRFQWMTGNKRKQDKTIYGQVLGAPEDLLPWEEQVIVAISAPADRKRIQQELEQQGKVLNENYFMFC